MGLCNFSIPQGSILCPLTFTFYAVPISNVITSFDVNFHQYADDTQLYITLYRSNVDAKLQNLEDCSRVVHGWFL